MPLLYVNTEIAPCFRSPCGARSRAPFETQQHVHRVDADLVVAADLDAYAEFVERVLRKQGGVSSIQSSLALREVKFSSRVPVPDA